MPRLDTLSLKITTGKRGPNQEPRYEINGFELDFNEVKGSNSPGETLELSGSPQSFPHSLTLIGPKEGHWDVERIDATYHSDCDEPYTIHLGAITLDAETKLNLKYDRPLKLLDV